MHMTPSCMLKDRYLITHLGTMNGWGQTNKGTCSMLDCVMRGFTMPHCITCTLT